MGGYQWDASNRALRLQILYAYTYGILIKKQMPQKNLGHLLFEALFNR